MKRNRRLHLLPALAASGLVALVLACHSAPEDETMPAAAPAAPRPTLNHAKHIAKKMACATCHDPDDKGAIQLPPVSLCWDCHEEKPADWPAPFKAYLDTLRQEDGSYAFSEIAYSPDLRMSHEAHAAAEVACAECHGEATGAAFGRPEPLALKKTCMDCHEQRGASNDCAVCHVETRRDRAPASHAGDFPMIHGKSAPAGWKRGEGGVCALCHEVPDGCARCHTERTPASHLNALFRREHGRAVEDGLFRDTSCSLCHEEQSCQQCHQVEKPRSHTVSFERRLHGVVASVDRETCRTCHQQETCDRCHSETRPLSHRGSWGSGRQTHCLGCHEPLQSNGCVTCHKDTLGHLQATPMPPGWPHETARQCRECHMVVPHVDSGGDGASCKRCHRVLR